MNDRRNSYICFIRRNTKEESQNMKQATSNNPQTLFLLSNSYNFNFFLFSPRLFTITTNSGSCKFNTYLLKDTSTVISKFLSENPNNLQYHLDIIDESNVLGKFEKLYQGEYVIFDEDELPVSKKITELLNIVECPNFMKPESLKREESRYFGFNANMVNSLGVEISIGLFHKFLQNEVPQTFLIKTKKKTYYCNVFGVYCSEIIRKVLLEDPTIEEYVYNYDDEFDEFKPICDFFNMKKVDLTKNNMESIKEIAEDLQIKLILKDVNDFINASEKVSQSIDEQQAIVESIDELFDYLSVY